jgi:hypothetical protein
LLTVHQFEQTIRVLNMRTDFAETHIQKHVGILMEETGKPIAVEDHVFVLAYKYACPSGIKKTRNRYAQAFQSRVSMLSTS